MQTNLFNVLTRKYHFICIWIVIYLRFSCWNNRYISLKYVYTLETRALLKWTNKKINSKATQFQFWKIFECFYWISSTNWNFSIYLIYQKMCLPSGKFQVPSAKCQEYWEIFMDLIYSCFRIRKNFLPPLHSSLLKPAKQSWRLRQNRRLLLTVNVERRSTFFPNIKEY